ncbi:Peptidyl-prolyl cis-trans isomerase fkbp9, partial [Lobulomyces angularis]
MGDYEAVRDVETYLNEPNHNHRPKRKMKSKINKKFTKFIVLIIFCLIIFYYISSNYVNFNDEEKDDDEDDKSIDANEEEAVKPIFGANEENKLNFGTIEEEDDTNEVETISQPTRLKIEIIKHSEHCVQQSKNGDTLEVDYTGKLFRNGEIFDSSLDSGKPFIFMLGKGQVIKGWDEGLLDMCVGEKRKLTIPSNLAYGESGYRGSNIKGGDALIFDIELLKIKSKVENKLTATPNSKLLVDITKKVENCTEKTKIGDTLTVDYVGTPLKSGIIFNSTYDTGIPFVFELGSGHLYKGWDQGLEDMCVGEERKLTIPGNIAYKDADFPENLLNDDDSLVFLIKLLSINSNKKSISSTKQPTELWTEVTKIAPNCLRKTEVGDVLEVDYIGTFFENGEVFESSIELGYPFLFTLGNGEVIKGWDEGLINMCVGEERKLTIPSNLAYGDVGSGKIKGGATLVFEITLLKIVNGQEPSVNKTTPTQLIIEVTKEIENCEDRSVDGDVLKMEYTGTLFSTGEKFDSSLEVGRHPFEFTLGVGEVIKGWDQGLLNMCVGEKRKLTIPSNLAYGEKGAGKIIKPGEALVFEVHLLEIKSSLRKTVDIKKNLTEITDEVFFDIQVGEENVHRVVFGLWGNALPKTVENFKVLASGEKGYGYKGSKFHRLIKGFMIQGGDFTNANGTGGKSIYGEKFEDEGFPFEHNGPGQLAMANSGKNTNGSQFYITFAATKWLDGKHVVFGTVIEGLEFIMDLQNIKVRVHDVPEDDIVIKDCACGRCLKEGKECVFRLVTIKRGPKRSTPVCEVEKQKKSVDPSTTLSLNEGLEKPVNDSSNKEILENNVMMDQSLFYMDQQNNARNLNNISFPLPFDLNSDNNLINFTNVVLNSNNFLQKPNTISSPINDIDAICSISTPTIGMKDQTDSKSNNNLQNNVELNSLRTSINNNCINNNLNSFMTRQLPSTSNSMMNYQNSTAVTVPLNEPDNTVAVTSSGNNLFSGMNTSYLPNSLPLVSIDPFLVPLPTTNNSLLSTTTTDNFSIDDYVTNNKPQGNDTNKNFSASKLFPNFIFPEITQYSYYNALMNGVYTTPLFTNPIPNFQSPFEIFEISSEAGIKHFLNEDIPITPSEKILIKQNGESGLNYVLYRSLINSNLISLIPLTQTRLKQLFHMANIFDQNEFNKNMDEIPDYTTHCFFAFGCLRSKHPLLFTEEFGGSPSGACAMFLQKSIDSLRRLNPSEHFSLDVLNSKYCIGVLFIYFGNRERGIYWLMEVYRAAELYDWDRPYFNPEDKPKNILQEKYPGDMKERRILWARLTELTSLASKFIIIDETQHSYMLSEVEWEKVGVVKEVGNPYDLSHLTLLMQLCFLYRRVMRFILQKKPDLAKENPLQFFVSHATSDISMLELHNTLTSWYEYIPSGFRTFDTLADFINGPRQYPDYEWINHVFNLSSNCWFLCSIMKLHHYNYFYLDSKNYKFKFSEKLEVQGDSLEIILTAIRALTSVLLIKLPKQTEMELKSDKKPFVYSVSVDILLTCSLNDVIKICLESCNSKLGCFTDLKIRKEVTVFHLKKVYLRILKERNNNYSRNIYEKYNSKVEKLLQELEIEE